jgi:hypothetical protein
MASYDKVNPASVLRDAMLDPLPELKAMGLAVEKIFGIPSLLDGAIGRGRAIDCSQDPGILHGSLLVRSAQDILSAADGAVAEDIGAVRTASTLYDPTEVAFSMKQYNGKSTQPIHHMTHGFVMSEEAERLLVQQSAAAVWLKLEKACAGFFTNKAAEAEGDKGMAGGGWDEIDWQGGATGGTDLDESDNFLDIMSSVIAAQRLRGSAPVNAMYMSRTVAEKLCREASVLGRVTISKSGVEDTNTLAAFQGKTVIPVPFLAAVLRDHLEIDELVIGSCPQKNAGGVSSYIWPDSRIWIGTAGSLDFSVNGGKPRVLSGAGAFCQMVGKTEVAVGPEAGNAPQNFEAISEVFSDFVAVDPSKGALIHNLG